MLPEHKALEVRRLQDEGGVVAMVGDGINHAPALAQADVGFAIGIGIGIGIDVAIEGSDTTLISGALDGVVTTITLSRRRPCQRPTSRAKGGRPAEPLD